MFGRKPLTPEFWPLNSDPQIDDGIAEVISRQAT